LEGEQNSNSTGDFVNGSSFIKVFRVAELSLVNEMIRQFNAERASKKRQSNPGTLSYNIKNNVLIVSGSEGVGKSCIVERILALWRYRDGVRDSIVENCRLYWRFNRSAKAKGRHLRNDYLLTRR
jgi:hypothetical protein